MSATTALKIWQYRPEELVRVDVQLRGVKEPRRIEVPALAFECGLQDSYIQIDQGGPTYYIEEVHSNKPMPHWKRFADKSNRHDNRLLGFER